MDMKIEDPAIESSMHDMKERLLSRIFLSVLGVGFIFSVVNFINEWVLGSVQMTYAVIMFYSILLIMHAFRRKIHFEIRAYTIIFILFGTGIVSGLTYGMVGSSMLFYVGAAYVAMLLLSKRETIYWMAMTLFIYLVIYVFWVSGILTYEFSVMEYAVSETTLISRMVAFIFFVGLLIFSQWMVNEFLVDKMNDLKQTHDELRLSDKQLIEQYNEILNNREEIKLKEEQYRSIVENTEDLIYAVTPEKTLITANSSFSAFMNMDQKELIGTSLDKLKGLVTLIDENDRNVDYVLEKKVPIQFVQRIEKPVGRQIYHTDITPVMHVDGSFTMMLIKHHNVTELVHKDEQIEQLAYFDQLTGLVNRYHFEAIISEKINDTSHQFGIIYFDLDHFKKINDTIGHFAGDYLLKQVAEMLQAVLPEEAILARLGGDEFAVLIDEASEGHSLTRVLEDVADTVVKTARKPVNIDGVHYYISASAGVVVYPIHGSSHDELMKNVDTAMYKAKNDGKNKWIFFNAEIKDETDQSILLEAHLRHAFEYDEMYVDYQPLVSGEDEHVRGFEALMRWNSNYFGPVSPAVFIPVLEQTGMIVEFGEWILKEAMNKIHELASVSDQSYVVSVNVSLLQLKQERFATNVKRIMDEWGVNPASVELEITESILADDVDLIINVLSELKQFGIRIALDDFGTGYSSLSYLRKFPLDTLKIDKSFSEGIGQQQKQIELIGSIIQMAHKIGLEVVAEGIEEPEQVAYLKRHHCDYFQGYYFHKPLNDKDLLEVVKTG